MDRIVYFLEKKLDDGSWQTVENSRRDTFGRVMEYCDYMYEQYSPSKFRVMKETIIIQTEVFYYPEYLPSLKMGA